MRDIKILRNPGYIYDLFYVYSLYYNYAYHQEKDMLDKNRDVSLKHIDKIRYTFPMKHLDLDLFFRINEKGVEFMSTYYFAKCIDDFSTEYSFNYVIRKLANTNELVKNLFEFYFPDFVCPGIEYLQSEQMNVARLVEKSDYDSDMKVRLYSFIIDPQRFINNLMHELMASEAVLNQYYESNAHRILEMYDMLDPEYVEQNFEGGVIDKSIFNTDQNLYATFCLLSNCCLRYINNQNILLFVLGVDFKEYLKELNDLDQQGDLDLCGFCRALGDEGRMDIINLLIEKGEVTSKDLERTLKFSGSTAYYHLSLMIKFGVVKTRHDGRLIYYSLNKDKFRVAAGELYRYAERR